MGRAPKKADTGGRPSGLPLPDPKGALKAFYAGTRLESPVGGFLEVLGVHSLEDGSATVILECSTSSIRFELPIKAATRTEKAKVKQALADGSDPTCPRHGSEQRLFREGSLLVCHLCGIPFGKAA